MTIKKALYWAIEKLRKTKLDSPALDVEVILSFVLKKDKIFLFTHPEKKLTSKQLEKFKNLIKRRFKREPVAYITNQKEFFKLNFYVDKNVLIPRPETELIVKETLKILKKFKEKINLIDVGTGSGAVLISVLKWIPRFSGTAIGIDFSKSALKIAKKNARKHKILDKIKFAYGNLLENIKFKNNENYIITANLPYLTTEYYKKLSANIKKFEPRSALVAGKDGLKYYRELFIRLDSRLRGNDENKYRNDERKNQNNNNARILLEIDPLQIKSIKKIIKQYFPKSKIQIRKDFAGLDRLVIIKL